MITEQQIHEGFDFYEIDEPAYDTVLCRVREEIAADAALQAGWDKAFARIYTDSSALQCAIWDDFHSMEELFGIAMPDYTVNLFVLSGYAIHRAHMEQRALPREQVTKQLFRVRQQLLMGWKPAPCMGVTPILWSSEFINLRIVEIGRLQFEFFNVDGKQPKNTVGLHIPPEGRLDKAAVDSAFAAAPAYLTRVFGAPADEYVGHSWLLSNQLTDLFAPGSNLAYFASLFTVYDSGRAEDDIKGYVFHTAPSTPVEQLAEDTSLQRAIKARMLTGQPIYAGQGTMKKQHMKV